jgi:rhodanese-related sulfurtransferase
MLPAEADKLLGTALFVDVREAHEYEAGHIEGSLHLPIGQIPMRWQELRSDLPIVVVCQIGQRSALVAEFLQARGLEAHNLQGGLKAWSGEGLGLSAASPRAQVIDGWARDLSGERLHKRR